jgi:hypothetical protein
VNALGPHAATQATVSPPNEAAPSSLAAKISTLR